MGVSGLWTLLAPGGQNVPLEALSGQRVAVDVSVWLVSLATATAGSAAGESTRTACLAGLFSRCCKLLFLGVRPVFVFDGPVPLLKRRTVQARRAARLAAARDQEREKMRLWRIAEAKARSARAGTLTTSGTDMSAAEKELEQERLEREEMEQLRDAFLTEFDGISTSEGNGELDGFMNGDGGFVVNNPGSTAKETYTLKMMYNSVAREQMATTERLVEKYDSSNPVQMASEFCLAQMGAMDQKGALTNRLLTTRYKQYFSGGRFIPGGKPRFRPVASDPRTEIMFNPGDGAFENDHIDSHAGVKEKEECAEFVVPEEEVDQEKNEVVPPLMVKPISANHPSDSSSSSSSSSSCSNSEDESDEPKSECKPIMNTNENPSHAPTWEELVAMMLASETAAAESEKKESTEHSKSDDAIRDSEQREQHGEESFTLEQDNPIIIDEKKEETEEHMEEAKKDDDVSPEEEEASTVAPSAPPSAAAAAAANVDSEDDDDLDGIVLPFRTAATEEDMEKAHQQDEEDAFLQAISSAVQPQFAQLSATGDADVNDVMKATGSELEEQATKRPSVFVDAPHSLDFLSGGDDLSAFAGVVDQCRELLHLFGIPYITSPSEADCQCAQLELSGLVDAVISDDSDVFLFGAQNVYRHAFSSGKHMEYYSMADIQRTTSFDREDLISLALLLGADYTLGVTGVGLVRSVEILSCFEDLSQFHQWCISTDEEREERRKELPSGPDVNKMLRSVTSASKRFTFPSQEWPSNAVLEGYRHPLVNDSKEPFHWGEPNFDALRRFCFFQLGWNIERIERVLNPVIKQCSSSQKPDEQQTASDITQFFSVDPSSRNRSFTRFNSGTQVEDMQKMSPSVLRIMKNRVEAKRTRVGSEAKDISAK